MGAPPGKREHGGSLSRVGLQARSHAIAHLTTCPSVLLTMFDAEPLRSPPLFVQQSELAQDHVGFASVPLTSNGMHSWAVLSDKSRPHSKVADGYKQGPGGSLQGAEPYTAPGAWRVREAAGERATGVGSNRAGQSPAIHRLIGEQPPMLAWRLRSGTKDRTAQYSVGSSDQPQLHWLRVARASSPLPATVADSDLRLFLFFDIFAPQPPQT